MKKIVRIFILAVLLICSLCAAAYPLFYTWYSERHNSQLQIQYQEYLEDTESEAISEARAAAQEYNCKLAAGELSPLEYAENGYYDLLNVTGNNIIGFLEIPAIGLSLTVYHGTSAEVLSIGVGHMEETSLPIGGCDTHAVLSAHTGTTDQRMFTDLVLLEEGDVFYLTVLEEKMAYQVDQIKTVLPDDVRDIQIIEGEDLITLSTCTPYGINTHRLLVRGHRIELEEAAQIEETSEDDSNAPAESIWMQKYIQGILCGLLCAVAFILLLLIVTLIHRRRKKKYSLSQSEQNVPCI